MKLTIEAASGQKYFLTGEELVEGFSSFLVNETFDGNPARFLERFLSTYEELPKPYKCKVCGTGDNDHHEAGLHDVIDI